MADYYQVKNQNIFTPPANISLGNTSNQYSNVYVQNNLVVGNVTVTSSTIIAPRVTTITYPGNDTAADPAGGQTITLTGSGFVVSASILINSIAVSVVSVVSSTVITFTSPANSSGSYVIYVVNPDGSTAIAVPGIQYSGIPTWTTAAGTLGNLYETASFTQTVVATGDAPITYSVASGTLPPGATFNGNGTITGTSQLTASPTTYTFTVSATDAEQQDTNRSFSLTINTDVVTWTTPANNSTTTLGQNVASTTTLLATSAAGKAITYTANALPTGLSISGATVTGTPTVIGNTTSLFTATAATTGRTTTATINWTISVSGDTYFPYTTLLLSGGTSTSTFIADASTNNFALAIAGDTKPNNFNPYTPGYYSNYFDGTGDYLTVPYSSVFDYGTGDFTIEAWIYLTITPYQGDAIFCSLTTGGSAFQFYSSTQLALGNTGIAWRAISNSTSFPICTWHHVAVSRASGTAYFWLNGVNIGTVAETNAFNAASSAIAIGKSDAGLFTGYISNLRVLKGTALYTTTFTPSTTPLTAIANTSLLTCQSNRFVDNSTNAFVVTKYGDTTVSPATPFVPNTAYATYGSTYFDGTGDYLSLASNSAFAFSTGDYTFECWINSSTTTQQVVFTSGGTGTNNFNFSFAPASGYIGVGTQVAWVLQATSLTLSIGVWYHVAASRSSGTLKLFLNGAQVASGADSTTWIQGGSLAIGNNAASGQYTTGYLTDVRVVKGTAVYTAAFTPPSTPLTAITNTSLLTCQTNQPVNNNVFLDNSTNAFAVTRVGNTSAGTFTPYGANWSNYFDGTGDSLQAPSSASISGTGDFTAECWIYPTTIPGSYNIIGCSDTSGGLTMFGLNSNGTIFMGRSLMDVQATTSNSLSYNTWNHIAISRSSGTVRLFINGIQGYSGSITTNYNAGTVRLGTDGGGSALPYTGYISNFRIITNSAVYTANFTPSTTPLTAISGTSLLTCQSNRFKDNSTNNFTITKNGDTSVQRFSPFSPSAAYSTSTIGGSGYLSGASSTWLAVPINATFAFGTNNYTYEAWVYPTAFPNAYNTIFCNFRDDEGAKGWSLLITSTGLIHVNNQGTYNNSTNALSLNTWTHIAVCRVGNTVTRYINGVADPTTLTVTASITNVAAQGPTIGGSPEYSTTREWTGYISNARVISRTALYTSNFTPSTTPFTAVSGTSLLLNYTSAGVYDSTMINDLETVDDAKILSTQTPYAGSYYSNYFDGTGDYLELASNSAFNMNTYCCLEAWVNYTTIGTSTIIAGRDSNYQLGYNFTAIGGTANKFVFTINNGSSWQAVSSTTTPVAGVWYHVVGIKDNTTLRIYINGTQENTAAFSGTAVTGSNVMGIGANQNTQNMAGYVSNTRLVLGASSGVLPYTGNFTSPTTPLTAVSGTALLTCQSNRFLDNSTNAFTITKNGDTSVQSFNPFQRNSAATMYFDGTGDFLLVGSTPGPLTPLISSGAVMTIESWVYATTLRAGNANDTHPSIVGLGAVYLNFGVANGTPRFMWYNGAITFLDSSIAITANTWNHIAVVFNGSGANNLKMYVNGVLGGTGTFTNLTWSTGAGGNNLYIGAVGNNQATSCWPGYINDLRITKGVARYTSTFTPPTSAFLTT